MGIELLSFLRNLWPFSSNKDLKLSDRLVNRLSLPDHTKQFVFAIPEPESNSVVYILATQNLSEQSAIDAKLLIKEVQPELVVVQVAPSVLTEERNTCTIGGNESGGSRGLVPTSCLGVLRSCFLDKINKDKYESLAGRLILSEIFGVGFYGHFFAAKEAAKEVGSTVLLLESPYLTTSSQPVNESDDGRKKVQALGGANSNSLVADNVGCAVSNRNLFSLSNDFHLQTVKSLVSGLAQVNLNESGSGSVSQVSVCQPVEDYVAPSFAQSVYSYLTDLHDIFVDLPIIGVALGNAQKMLHNVEKGEAVDRQVLSDVQTFRIAVEGVRIGFNNAGRRPIASTEHSTSSRAGFSELSVEDKSHTLFAQAIRSQTKKFKSVVAIVDVSSLHGLRKHWNTPLPPEVEEFIEQFFAEDEGEGGDGSKNRRKIVSGKSVVAVGAGATAVLGASSLSKALPASTFMKLVSYSVPPSLKLGFVQSQKAMAFAFSKILGSSKILAPGFVSSGAKSTSAMKATVSADRMRIVARGVIASAERNSFSTMRSAFYEIMRKRRVHPIRSMPWATFGCSFITCAGLISYGDRIERVAESVPMAPSIASIGRGLQSLHQASQEVRQADGTRIKEAINSLMCSLKNGKFK